MRRRGRVDWPPALKCTRGWKSEDDPWLCLCLSILWLTYRLMGFAFCRDTWVSASSLKGPAVSCIWHWRRASLRKEERPSAIFFIRSRDSPSHRFISRSLCPSLVCVWSGRRRGCCSWVVFGDQIFMNLEAFEWFFRWLGVGWLVLQTRRPIVDQECCFCCLIPRMRPRDSECHWYLWTGGWLFHGWWHCSFL